MPHNSAMLTLRFTRKASLALAFAFGTILSHSVVVNATNVPAADSFIAAAAAALQATNIDAGATATASDTDIIPVFELWNTDTDTKIVDIPPGIGKPIFAIDDIYNASGTPTATAQNASFPNVNIVARFSPGTVDFVQFGLYSSSSSIPSYVNDSYRIERQAPFSLCGKSGATALLPCATEAMVWGGTIFVNAMPYQKKFWSRLFPRIFSGRALVSSVASFVLVPTCPVGYVQAALPPQSTGLCVDFNECASPTTNDCANTTTFNTSCFNRPGSYSCSCPGGFDGNGRNGNCTRNPCYSLFRRPEVSCADCVEAGCGWTSPVGRCRLSNCQSYPNTVCYDLQTDLSNLTIRTARSSNTSTSSSTNTTTATTNAVCAAAAQGKVNDATCRRQTTCESCTSITFPDSGNSTPSSSNALRQCHWYEDVTGRDGLCGLGPVHDELGCNGQLTCPKRKGLLCRLWLKRCGTPPPCDY